MYIEVFRGKVLNLEKAPGFSTSTRDLPVCAAFEQFVSASLDLSLILFEIFSEESVELRIKEASVLTRSLFYCLKLAFILIYYYYCYYCYL